MNLKRAERGRTVSHATLLIVPGRRSDSELSTQTPVPVPLKLEFYD